MKVIEEKTHITEEVIELVCDRCGAKEKRYDMSGTNVASFRHTFGFLSKRDNDEISFELCEKCLMEMLKTFEVNYYYKEYGSCYKPGDKEIVDGG